MFLCVSDDKKTQKDYDVVLQDDFINLTNIPRKSVYVSSGLAIEVKKYQKRFYVFF